MSTATAPAGPLRLDPTKRVNYTLGLVLGVDEFQQDQLYHASGRRWHNRLLHGYGTVWGLGVEGPNTASEMPEIRVHPGVAVDPGGREICVPDVMCVRVNQWLARHSEALAARLQKGADTVPVAVVLCHRECAEDSVPVPGEPCRTQEDAMQPSRLRDTFELRLALRNEGLRAGAEGWNTSGVSVFDPAMPEEGAVRAFGALLRRVTPTTVPVLSAGGEAELLDEVGILGATAEGDEVKSEPILIPAERAPEILERAMRLWITTVRPGLRGEEGTGDPCGVPADAGCVLLGELDVPFQVKDNALALRKLEPAQTLPIEEARRPYLLHTRLIQEWITAAHGSRRTDIDAFATIEVLGPRRVRLWLHHEKSLTLGAGAVELFRNGEADGGVRVEVPTDPPVRNTWDVILEGDKLWDGDTVEIRVATDRIYVAGKEEAGAEKGAEGEEDAGEGGAEGGGVESDGGGARLHAYTIYDRIEGGDLADEDQLPKVVKIQGHPVRRVQPKNDEYLRWTGKHWEPMPLPEGTADLRNVYPASRVTGLQGVEIAQKKPTAGQFLVFDKQWAPGVPRFSPKSDLGGTYPNISITGLQGHPLRAPKPQGGEILQYDSDRGEWIAGPIPDPGATGPAGGDLSGTYPNPEVSRIGGTPLDIGAAANGQILQYREAGEDGDSAWVAADPPAGGGVVPDPGGDVEGPLDDLRVTAIRGKPVNDEGLSDGRILRYRGSATDGEWVVDDMPGGTGGDAGGDLSGSYPAPRIAALQGTPVDARAPGEGDYLGFDGKNWTHRGAVSAPSGAYEIIAAGRFTVLGDRLQHLGPPYGGLKLSGTEEAGLYLLTGPEWSFATHQHVVKGTWEAGAVLPAGRTDEGLLIRLLMLYQNVKTGELHLEVSRYPGRDANVRLLADSTITRELTTMPTVFVRGTT